MPSNIKKRRYDEDDHDDKDDRDERPSRKRKSGSSGAPVGLIIGLVVGGVVLLGGAGVGAWLMFGGSDSSPGTTVTVNGQKVNLDDADKAMKEAMEKQFKDLAKDMKDAGKMPKGKAPVGDPGKLPKNAGKEIDKAFEKAFKDLGKGKEKATDPRLTVKPESIQLPDKTRGQIHILRGRKDMFVVEKSAIKANPAAKEQVKEMMFTRFDLRNGKELGTFTLNLPWATGNVEDVSPDGGLVGIRNFGIGMDLIIVSLADGKFLANNYKPAYLRTNADGSKAQIGAKNLRFLDSRRWLVLYEDDAVDVWTNSASGWQRKQIRAGSVAKKRDALGETPNGWCVSNDSKTLAMWNGQGFDLIDTSTGAVRGRTANLEPGSDEAELIPRMALFSPDGSQILTSISAKKKRGRKFFHACLQTTGSQAPVRLTSDGLTEMVWWGERHLLQIGNRNFSYSGVVFDATTGKPLADFTQKGSLVKQNPDGKMRVFTDTYGEEKTFLVQCAFPDKLLEELQKPRDNGKLPVVQANQTGVGIRP